MSAAPVAEKAWTEASAASTEELRGVEVFASTLFDRCQIFVVLEAFVASAVTLEVLGWLAAWRWAGIDGWTALLAAWVAGFFVFWVGTAAAVIYVLGMRREEGDRS